MSRKGTAEVPPFERAFGLGRPPWERVARIAALVGWLAAPLVVLVVPQGRVFFWTLLVAALPASWMFSGYYVWRRICPLATVSQLGTWLDRPGKRKVSSPLLLSGAMAVQLAIMIACLWLRLVAINGSSLALAAFLVLLGAAAAGVGFVYTGRTWCHYVCPLGFVEKVYAEPVALPGGANSQCHSCTGCKKQCPDIDLEQGYWKETGHASRALAYYAWPGVVVGFYLYYFLYAGTWDWYFSGDWAHQDDQLHHAFDPMAIGGLPAAYGALLVLIGCGALSGAVFLGVERWWAVPQARHKLQAVAGYVAFNLFYMWAGQPTLRLLPRGVQALVAFAVVAVSTVMLARRFGRDEQQWVREKFARRLINRWTLGEAPANATLEEVYVVHTERERERAARIKAYRETLHELASEGVLTRDRLVVLDTVRAQLGITAAEHAEVVARLEAADQALFDPQRVASSERELQKRQYRATLEGVIHAGAPLTEAVLRPMREAHGVTEAEHLAILAELQDPDGAIGTLVRRERAAIEELGRISAGAASFTDAPGAADLVIAVARWRARARMSQLGAFGVEDGAPAWLDADPLPGEPGDVLAGLEDESPWLRAAIALLGSRVAPDRVRPLTRDVDPVVREAAALGLVLRGEALDGDVGRASERAGGALAGWVWPLPAEPALARLTVVEALILLRTVDLLRCVAPPELAQVARRVDERAFATGEELCRLGDVGDDVFVVLSGRVSVWLGEREIRQAGAGSVIGELAAIDPAPRSATVRATEPTRVLVLAGGDFRDLLEDQRGLSGDVIKHLARRLRSSG